MKDPMGWLITTLRADTAVAALVSSKVRGEVLDGETPPLVVVTENATTRRPFGPGSGWIKMQLATYVAKCYGPDATTGAITARQLAGAVSDAVHNHSPSKVGTTYVARAYASELEGLQRDPDTRWPHVDVRIDLYAAAEAVA